MSCAAGSDGLRKIGTVTLWTGPWRNWAQRAASLIDPVDAASVNHLADCRVVSLGEAVVLFLAGLGGGLCGSVAGLASLVSYPTLLALGLDPVSANVTNTVSIVCSSIGAITGSRPELAGQRDHVIRVSAVAVCGGALGGALLLVSSSSSFERVVPWLLVVASASILIRRRLVTEPGDAAGRVVSSIRTRPKVLVAIAVVGIYAGYFGAGAGVMMLALLLFATNDSLPRTNAVKNVIDVYKTPAMEVNSKVALTNTTAATRGSSGLDTDKNADDFSEVAPDPQNSGPVAPAGPAVDTVTNKSYSINQAITPFTVTASGGNGQYTWSATDLPTGLDIAPATGEISGTPTTAGTSSVTVTAKDASNATGTTTFSITVNPVVETITPIADNEFTEFDETIAATIVSGSGYTIAQGTAAPITLHDDTPYNYNWASQFPTFAGANAAPNRAVTASQACTCRRWSRSIASIAKP